MGDTFTSQQKRVAHEFTDKRPEGIAQATKKPAREDMRVTTRSPVSTRDSHTPTRRQSRRVLFYNETGIVVTDLRCSLADCSNKGYRRNLCQRHYNEQRQSPDFVPDRGHSHSLSSINEHARTAVCAVCGPTEIKVRRQGKASECMTRVRQQRAKVTPEMQLRADLWKDYRITLEQRDQLLQDQCGACAICGAIDSQLVVDHDHKTGQVRGLLCKHCNWGIGHLRDDPVRIARAAQYVQQVPQFADSL